MLALSSVYESYKELIEYKQQLIIYFYFPSPLIFRPFSG